MKGAEELWNEVYKPIEQKCERITVDGKDYLLEADIDDWSLNYKYWDNAVEAIRDEVRDECVIAVRKCDKGGIGEETNIDTIEAIDTIQNIGKEKP